MNQKTNKNIFVDFLVQMKTFISAFKINWPLDTNNHILNRTRNQAWYSRCFKKLFAKSNFKYIKGHKKKLAPLCWYCRWPLVSLLIYLCTQKFQLCKWINKEKNNDGFYSLYLTEPSRALLIKCTFWSHRKDTVVIRKLRQTLKDSR